MFRRSLPYKPFLRIAGIALLLLALYQTFLTATRPFSIDGIAPPRFLITVSLSETFVEIASTNVLVMLAVSLVLLGMSSLRTALAYWCLQIAVWLIGISQWYQQSTQLDTHLLPGLATPPGLWPWMAITLLCSLLLFVFYKPVLRWLDRLINLQGSGMGTS